MKKLLGLLAATGMVASTGASVIACNPGTDDSNNVDDMSLEQLVKEYDKKHTEYKKLEEELINESNDSPDMNKIITLLAELSELGYKICQIDNSKIEDEMFKILTKEQLILQLNGCLENDLNEEAINYINTIIKKYS